MQGHTGGKAADERWATMLRGAIAGDAELYRRLLDEIGRSVRVMARGALSRAHVGDADIEDIVQETLLAIHLKRHSWDSGELLAPWVFAIARHKTIDALRKRGNRRFEPIEDFEEALAAPEAPDPHDRSDVERLLRELAPRPRSIVRAISLEGESIAATAKRLSMSKGAVRVALHRALKSLAEIWRNSQSAGRAGESPREAGRARSARPLANRDRIRRQALGLT